MRFKIFSKVTQKTAQTEVQPKTAPFISKVDLKKFVLGKGLFKGLYVC